MKKLFLSVALALGVITTNAQVQKPLSYYDILEDRGLIHICDCEGFAGPMDTTQVHEYNFLVFSRILRLQKMMLEYVKCDMKYCNCTVNWFILTDNIYFNEWALNCYYDHLWDYHDSDLPCLDSDIAYTLEEQWDILDQTICND